MLRLLHSFRLFIQKNVLIKCQYGFCSGLPAENTIIEILVSTYAVSDQRKMPRVMINLTKP